MTITVRLQREPFDSAKEIAALTRGRSDIGANAARLMSGGDALVPPNTAA